jgi:hypothetical protein
MFATNGHKLLQSVAMQLTNGDEVVLDDQTLRVTRVGGERLRMVRFKRSKREFEAIEQNQKKASRWRSASLETAVLVIAIYLA